ncbi:TMV resistance protein N-like isoform X4 [Daucus carota subsp. sativus]|uniref:TMV resistance protein N-like isoform X4 n=1 Tax=Daucus carota subsp. sativus TaxID=79200 RepID=UPI003083C036
MASTSAETPTSWDVFLSFRGIDTRLGFVSHLYSALDRNGIRTFMDDPELRLGDGISAELLKAIRESKIYIVVLSVNYASSSWCLDELVEILDCKETMKRLVIPVFFNIDPSVVRYQKGSFEEHFRVHGVRYADKMERMENWRRALSQLAENSGIHIDGKKTEADIVNEIVKEILLQIKPTTLDVAKYPVGLDSRVEDITAALLSRGTKGVIKIGIYGMGGVGKTTLAKALFNKLLLGSFEGSCFLENVRETSGYVKGLESLQQQLISDVLKISKDEAKVSSVDQGTEQIERRICSRKSLVVIDDLEDPEKFESLVRSFAPGSVVIITTRDEDILRGIEVETQYRYKVNEMAGAEAETLFFRHAFRDTEPNDTLRILSKDVLRLAGGLPLALKVFGSYLHNKPEVKWKSYIEKVQRDPDSSIEQRLRISLDANGSDDPLLKKMFLDIACLFIGRKKKNLVEILDTYYPYADDKIDILEKRSLLTFNERDLVRMHDLLQDMGRKIARNNCPDEPGKHSRLWVRKEIWDVLEKDKGTEAIEGILHNRFKSKQDEFFRYYLESIKLDHFNIESFSTETLRRMTRLRFFYLDGISLTGKFKLTLEDLRWFCWNQCPLECLPFDFSPQKLVILELPASKLTTMWEVKIVSEDLTTTPDFRGLTRLENLKTLNMSFSKDLTSTPDFRRLPRLQNLYLEGCRSLKEVHKSIGSLVRLVSLNLKDCVNLRSLPDTICNLGALEVLCIEYCTGLKALPIELGNIKSLKELNASETSFPKLPDSIGDLSKLVKLKLDRHFLYGELESLPNTICNLRELEVLKVSVKALPDDLGNIESLRELNAWGIAVSKLPDSICDLRSLEILDISYSNTLERLPDQLWKLTSLLELNASWTNRLEKVPDIESSQTSLPVTKLDLSYSEITALPSGICQLSKLEVLDLHGCGRLLSTAELPPNLKYIFADDCKSLKRLNLSNLKLLRELQLTNCSDLTEILGLEELTCLEKLLLRGCRRSLLTHTLTKPLFQMYSALEQKINIQLDVEGFPDWIIPDASSSVNSSKETSASNYFAMILCFDQDKDDSEPASYSVMTSASNIFKSRIDSSGIVIVPRSIFTVTDTDHTIIFASTVDRHWIHLLYKNEDNNITLNVADEENTSSTKTVECWSV